MRLVVTGRDGQVATALALAGGRREIEVVRLGRPELDLERLETLAPALQATRPDVLVSAAAYTAVDQAESEPERAHQVNALAPARLAEVAAELGAPILHLSTDYVFDGRKPSPYVEADATGPVTVYGVSKLAGEIAVAHANFRHVILRTAWVYAPHGKNFVRTMLRLAETRDEVGVVGDQLGCPTSADDIAEGVLKIAAALHAGQGEPGLYHMAGTGEASWAEFAAAIFEGSQRRGGPFARVRVIATADYPKPAARPANSRLDCGRVQATFGVALPTWWDGLGRCLDSLAVEQGWRPPD
ncbi:dTDP-4-dehydrorhamnose reductase [Caulobacter sp. S45]|uniref:dTDP-4-dehydrorhamnose reductase n=1 Tax=Caulobacter sp. S45 TaxID=1641861 RepID=UPI001576EAFE|nr:dTDP-4-dehydrorhamnose reductase [Caulobacter sp. S45]